jgi:CheY-like chemotaxis protein
MMGQILLIEDERDLRETLKLFLELEGFRVAAAQNGREGLDLLDESGPPCLIVLDLMMPVMNGWEFLEALKQEHQAVLSDTPMVVITASPDVGQQVLDSGCRIMKKPFDVAPLLSIAREYCGT